MAMAMVLGQVQRRYSRFVLQDACRNSRIVVSTNPSTQQSIPRTHLHTFSSRIRQPILKNSQKRSYFNNREHDEGWFHSSKGVGFALFLFSCGAAIGISSGKWVTVPYTGRSHLILFHKFLEEFLGGILPGAFIVLDNKALPPPHPDSIKARSIYQNIIDQAFPMDMEITIDKDKCEIVVVDSTALVSAMGCGRFGKIYVTKALLHYYANYEEMIATNIGHEVGHDLARHVEEQYSKLISSVSMIGMSVYLFWQSTYMRSKMPYIVVEKLMRRRFLPSVCFVASVALPSYLAVMKYCREMEMEADYIGLMLASSAGYNPIVGLMYPVFGVENGSNTGASSILPGWFFPVPRGEKRSVRLAHRRVIDEAISRYPRATEPPVDPTDSS